MFERRGSRQRDQPAARRRLTRRVTAGRAGGDSAWSRCPRGRCSRVRARLGGTAPDLVGHPQHSSLGDTRQLLVHLHLAVVHRNTGQIVPLRIGTQTTEMLAVLCTRPATTPQPVQGSSEIAPDDDPPRRLNAPALRAPAATPRAPARGAQGVARPSRGACGERADFADVVECPSPGGMQPRRTGKVRRGG